MQLSTKTLNENEVLCTEGSVGKELYIIQEGQVGVYKESSEGSTHLATVGKNGIIGEMSLLDNQPRSATIRAIEKTKVLIINEGFFAATLTKAPVWLTSIIKIIVSRLRDANKRLDQTVLRDRERGLTSLMLILIPECRKEFIGRASLDYDPFVVEAYYVCRLKKKETGSILEKLARKGIVALEEDSDHKRHICFPDLEVVRLYYEYLTLRSQKKKFKEVGIPKEALATLTNIAYIAQKSGQETAEGTTLLKSLFIKDLDDKNSAKIDQQLLELRRKDVINILPEQGDSLIVFRQEMLSRIKKIHEWLPKFEQESP